MPSPQENSYLDEDQLHPSQFDDEDTKTAATIFLQLESLVAAIEQLQVWREEHKSYVQYVSYLHPHLING